jgi:hypothetical protein
MLLLGTRQEVTKKRAKAFPLDLPCSCRASKGKTRKDIRVYSATLAIRLPRAAGRGSAIEMDAEKAF